MSSQKTKEPFSQPSRSESDALFSQISQELQIQPKKRSRWRPYFLITAFRYFSKRIAVLVLGVIALIFTVFFLTSPLDIQNVQTSKLSPGNERISFNIDHSFWANSVNASLNNSPIPVTQTDSGYYVDVSDNGVLLLEVETVSHVRSQTEIVINSIDDEAPHIQTHMQNGNEIIIYLSDGDGEGIDWDAITITNLSGQALPLTAYDPDESYIILPYPSESIYIYVPDHAGNTLTALLKPASRKE